MAGKRIFAAIDVSNEVRRRVASYITQMRKEFGHVRVGWERPEKVHLTLKFYGDVGDSALEGIQRLLGDTVSRYARFTAELAGTGVFPNAQKPRTLWLGVQGDRRMSEQIGREIEGASRNLGFEAERRRFSPHLTIARIREPAKGRDLASAHIARGFAPIEFEIKELVLYESKLLSSGSVYSVLSRHELRGG